MSLKAFHLVFVTLSTLLAFVFGGWNLRAHAVTGAATYLALGLASFASGIALIVYGVWFRRKITTREEEDRRRRKVIRRLPVAALIWILGARAASACEVCYGQAEGPMIDAARLGVWLLFGMVLLVQLGFVVFFVQLARRARAARQAGWIDTDGGRA